MDTFTRAYIDCALWSTGPDSQPGISFEHLNYDVDDLAPETLRDIESECQDFQAAQAEHIKGREERAGHDFWLTRNRHGAGFWDGDWPEPVGRLLTEFAHAYGSSDLYLGDDGLIHVG